MKKLSTTTLSIALLVSIFTSSANAISTPNEWELISTDGAIITAKTITLDDLPEGVEPVYVNSKEEANALALESLSIVESNDTECNVSPDYGIGIMSTTGTYTVASETLGLGTVHLKVNYKTSGDNNTGSIIYASPFTTHTGFTWGLTWEEQDIGGYITSSGKDYYAYCSGTVSYYIFYEGIGTFYSRDLNMSGLAWIIH